MVMYYDVAFGITGDNERKFYLNKMRQYGGPVLDLAGGTGRFTILAAEHGFDVTYVDSSPGMASVLAEKVLTLSEKRKTRIETVSAAMSEFHLRKRYRLVICCDSFEHNLTAQDARSTLCNVRDTLADDGAFVFNIHFTSPTFLCFAASDEGSEWDSRGRYAIPGSTDELQVDQALDVDFISQRISTKLRFHRFNANGELIEEKYSQWESRYFNRYEIENLIELCGLAIVSVVGHYDGSPVDERSNLIYECRIAKG